MPWTNPSVQRCRAELALHASAGIFGKFFRANIPDKGFQQQLMRCMRWHRECTQALPARRVPAEMWRMTKKRLSLIEPYFQTHAAQNQDKAAEQWCVVAGVAGMLIIDVLCNCPDYHNRNWRFLSDTTDTLCLRYLYPIFPDAEEAATKLWLKVSA